MKKISAEELLNTVIDNNYCSGCGVCTATENSPFSIELNKFGAYEPVINDTTKLNKSIVCPFGDHQVDFDLLNKQKFGDEKINYNKEFGYYKNIYAGYVNQDNYRINGSSGGSVTWFTNQLLEKKIVDYIINVKETNDLKIRFEYQISDNINENKKRAKSKYYPITLQSVLEYIKYNEGQYAIVGIPCFIKGIQLLKQQEKIYQERIKYTISIFCGHLKTTHYLSSIISQFDIDESQVKHFNFRHKIPNRKASDYGTKIITKDDKELIKLNKEIFGTNWGLGLFKLKACDYCDDVIGESADISFGDAWIPEYENDYLGTNIIVTRNAFFDQIINENIINKNLHYEKISETKLLESQAGGFRHKREGLSYRLHLNIKKNKWSPPTKVNAVKIKSKKRRKLYKIRIKLQQISYYSNNYKKVDKLKKELFIYINRLNRVYQRSKWTRFRLWIKNKMKNK